MTDFRFIGPFGGGGGDPFTLHLPGQASIPGDWVIGMPVIRYGNWIDALMVWYWDPGHTQPLIQATLNRSYRPNGSAAPADR
jgi:hypothetical protein